MIRVQVIGDEALAQKLADASHRMEGRKPAFIRACGNIIKDNIERSIFTNLDIRTGALIGSVRVFGQTKNTISIGTGRGLDYVRPLEFGAMPHIIRAGYDTRAVFSGDVGHYRFITPEGSRFLHFFDREGRERFAKQVMHPGNRPYRFVYKGTMYSLPEVATEAMNYIAEAYGVAL